MTTKKLKATSKSSSSFFDDVYAVVQLIPPGCVTSYGAIARYLGSGQSARMVGWALNALSHDLAVPAHRVVNSQGLLTGQHHFKPPSIMQQRLEDEGVVVKNNQVIHFENCFWDPSIKLL